jgi:CheY-like chemotaxis protein/signal transduction histidine kinase
MARPLALTPWFGFSVGVVILAAGTTWVIAAADLRATQRQAREAELLGRALAAAGQLAPLTDPSERNWPTTAQKLLQGKGLDVGPGTLQVLMEAPEAPARWRTIVALPDVPESSLPLTDPEVKDRLPRGGDAVVWSDPAGVQWCSRFVPLPDREGRTRFVVETRLPVEQHLSGGMALAAAVLMLGILVGLVLFLIAVRRMHRAHEALRLGIVSLQDEGGQMQAPDLPPELGPIAGSVRKVAEESTTRLTRVHREVSDLRKQVARFQGADRAKTTLLVALCRSLRRSVETMRSSVSLLIQTRLDRTQSEYTESLHAGCGDLLTRIGDVLDFALLEAECLSLEQRPLRPRLVLEEALVIVAERCSQLPIELAWHADAEVPERVFGDLARIRQVLVNLISLAASTAEEGTVVVHLSPAADSRLQFRISLMGVTLTAERIRLLLEGAISSDSSSDRLQGEGLGLVLGKRLSQAMGGSLVVARGEDEAIELVCTLTVVADAMAPERPLAGRRILVGHERPATRTMVASLLTRAGAEVVAVALHDEAAVALSGGGFAAAVLSTRVAGSGDGIEPQEVIGGVQLLAPLGPLLLLVDPVHRGYAADCRAAGAMGLLSSPVRQQALLGLLADAFAGIKPSQAVPPISTGESPRVLVVEDNEVNQLVLMRMLESLGIASELAVNGQIAVDLVRQSAARPYALILMDCMMPVMDGITATRTIRQEEEREPGVWIIAVTANAMANDRSKCLDAGMNDYLAKPVTPVALGDALLRWRQGTGQVRKAGIGLPPPVASGSHVATEPVRAVRETPPGHATATSATEVDLSGLHTLSRLAGRAAAVEVAGCFLGEAQGMIAAVNAAVSASDTERLRTAAHKLKGSSGTVGLKSLQALMSEVEAAAKESDMARAKRAAAKLPAVAEVAISHLQAFRDGVG